MTYRPPIPLLGPFRRRSRWTPVRALLTVLVFFMSFFLTLRAVFPEDARVPAGTWIAEEDVVRLMRFHGARELRVTEDGAFIRRGGKWIKVRSRG